MKTLILNGSPRRSGDTAALLARLRRGLRGEVTEISAYYGGIAPCVDCRECWKRRGCVTDDAMRGVYADDYSAVVIASPVYMSGLTGPLINLGSRFQAYYAARRFLRDPFVPREKTGVLILAAGGDGSPGAAIDTAKCMFRYMNASLDSANTVLSLRTDTLPAERDENALAAIDAVAARLSANALTRDKPLFPPA
ncbi:MAG: NAD(P)H-dependent oxidoreductase [Oscillospiraceae bacterium]|jgi:multimeric flavodoxin WrbA|nr:NAD(P)H-dependent oxidoreductase [Oscillospiraceae bacterium]